MLGLKRDGWFDVRVESPWKVVDTADSTAERSTHSEKDLLVSE